PPAQHPRPQLPMWCPHRARNAALPRVPCPHRLAPPQAPPRRHLKEDTAMTYTDPALADMKPGAERDWWVITGMTIAAASAAVASFSGLYGLAALAGWPVRLAWLLPLTL